jgi:prophage tail gpP-like protein
MSALETVILSAAGSSLRPIEIEWSASANEAARTFSAMLAPRDATTQALAAFAADVAAIGASLAAGPAVEITASGDLVLSGWIERYRPRISSTSPSIHIEGRSKSSVLVDSSAIHATGEWRKAKPAAIISELASRYGVEVTDKTVDSVTRPLWRLTPGVSVIAHAHRLARVDGQSITGTAAGGITVYRGTLGRHAGSIVEGVNLPEDSEAVHDWSKRAKKTTVKGQRADGWSAADLTIAETSQDATAKRPVEVVVIASEEIDARAAARRAMWRRDQTVGEGLRVMLPSMIGWRDGGGRLWEPGWTVWVESEYLGVAQEMAIESVKASQTDRGTICHLELVDPRALGAKGGKGKARKGRSNKSKSQWDMPSDE